MLNNFDQIADNVRQAGLKKKVVVWDADDAGWLKVVDKFSKDGLLEVTLIGDASGINKIADENQVDSSKFKLIESLSPVSGADYIKSRLDDNTIDILIRGSVGVQDSLGELLKTSNGFKANKKSIVSGVSCHYVQDIDRLLILSDPVVNPEPDLPRKIALVNNAVKFAQKLEFESPKVAMLAAVEVVYPVMPHTLDGAAIAKMSDRGQIKGCLVDGPLSMDVAVIEAAAKGKKVSGPVAGQANVLIAPTIETAYGMYKAFVQFVNAPSGCVVVGGKIPYVMASRHDSEETKRNSLFMAML